ncbi:MAG TPA: redox-sensing transcriptional repressor Rex [Spirochaetia bacterium]
MKDSLLQQAPGPTLRRLALYHSVLMHLAKNGREVVSCTRIGEELRFDPTQVRKDIELTGIVGKSRVGYEVRPLIDAIEEFLGWNNTTEAFLVGAGALGTALLGYERFQACGLSIVAAFDRDPAKVGHPLHGKEVLPMEKLVDLAKRMIIRMGIITVPAEGAQAVADLMVSAGIRAIWSFAPVLLTVPDSVIVEEVQLASSLAVLSSKLARTLKLEKAMEEQPNVSVDAAGSRTRN